MKFSQRPLHAIGEIALIGVGLILASCGGGSGGSGSTAPTVSGTAASGAAIANAAVTLKDRDGTTLTTTTTADGRYVLNVSGLVPPYLVHVEDGSADGLFSVGAKAGVVNVHPFTNVLVRLYYGAHGLDAKSSFDTLDLATPMPTRASVRTLSDMIERVLGPYLVAYGENPDTFDLIATPFAADGAKFDLLLELSVVETTALAATVSLNDIAGATDSRLFCDFNSDPDTQEVLLETYNTTSAGAERRAVDRVVLATGEDEASLEAAVSGVENTLQEMVGVMNARGTALSGGDLVGFFAPTYLNDGNGRDAEASFFAAVNAGLTQQFLGITRVVGFDQAKGIVAVKLAVRAGVGASARFMELPADNDTGFIFGLGSGGGWSFYGNQRIAWIDVKCSAGCDYTYVWPSDPQPRLELQLICEASAPTGTVLDAVVTGDLPPDGITSETLSPYGSFPGVDRFERNNPGTPFFPSAGSEYDFKFTLPGESVHGYAIRSRSYTEEPLHLVEYDGVAYAQSVANPLYHSMEFVHPGTPLRVTWTPPVTFPAAACELVMECGAGGDTRTEVPSDQLLGANATSATVTVPTTIGGKPTIWAQLMIRVSGKNGEETWLKDFFGT